MADEGIIEISDAKAWADTPMGKLPMEELDDALVASLSTQLLARLASIYKVNEWTDHEHTPSLIKKILGMQYVGWYYERTYADNQDESNYGTRLLASAETLIVGLVDGSLSLTDLPEGSQLDPNLGLPGFLHDEVGPVFAMGQIW